MTNPDDILRDLAERYSARGVQEVVALRLLQANWDGEGAEAPKPELIEIAIKLLRLLPELPHPSRVTATQSGNIVIEWQLDGGVYLEAEVCEPSRVEWMFDVPGQPIKHRAHDLAQRDFLPLLPRQREAMKTVWEQWDELEQKAKAEETK